MMDRLRSLWATYRRLPRAARWGVGATVVIVAFLLWNDHVMRLADKWNRQADQLLANVGEAARGRQRLRNLRAVREGVQAIGVVDMPGDESDAEDAFNDVINEVLKHHSVSRDSFSYRGPSKLPRGTLAQILAPGRQVERITGDLRFDATPEEGLSIVAELEASSDIEGISNLRITRAGPGKVTLDLTVEAWITSAEGRSKAGA